MKTEITQGRKELQKWKGIEETAKEEEANFHFQILAELYKITRTLIYEIKS